MKRQLVLDIELYSNYLLVMFKSIDTRKVVSFEAWPGQELDTPKVMSILSEFQIITFNGLDFDLPLLFMALRGESVAVVKKAANHIIEGGLRGWQFEQHYGVKVPKWVDHIDLKEPVPGVQISLKLYGARMHSKRLQDLPIDPHAEIAPEQRPEMRRYCENDLDTTIDLWLTARNPKDDIIATRELLSAEFGVDLRSKSDAQIAEAAIKARVAKLKGENIYKPEIAPGTVYRYTPPAWVKFETPALRAKLAEICAAPFVVKVDGKVAMPPCLEGAEVQIGASLLRMGVGGLHSSESCQGVVPTAGQVLRDTDVVSYYPALILLCGLFPKNMGDLFQHVYREFFTRRIHAKKSGHKSTAQTLKIVLNGSFGKLGSKYSVLYSPDLMIQVTVTGQLALLMLIERLEAVGVRVVSANTDGIVQLCDKSLDAKRQVIIAQWERETGLETEDIGYRGLFSRDVNNYVALKAEGGVKTKGVFTAPGVQKNPDGQIIGEAVCALLDRGVPVGETIMGCADLRKFITAQRVTGGAQIVTSTETRDDWVSVERGKWEMTYTVDGWSRTVKAARVSRPKPIEVAATAEYLGKVVRWYRSTRGAKHIEYATNGKKVGSSDMAMPVMDLPDEFPTDIDYGFYINEANDLLREIGAMK